VLVTGGEDANYLPVASAEKPTAVASFNNHQDHFTTTYGIEREGGGAVHTACLGFGHERDRGEPGGGLVPEMRAEFRRQAERFDLFHWMGEAGG